jgi:hypothetical protein
MKKYTIRCSFLAEADVEVLANSEDEARQKARNTEIPIENYHFEPDTETVEDEEEIQDLSDMIREVTSIIKQKEELVPEECPSIHLELWNGEDWETKRKKVSAVFWDNVDEQIGVELSDESDVLLDELTEIEQYEVCKSVINTKTV